MNYVSDYLILVKLEKTNLELHVLPCTIFSYSFVCLCLCLYYHLMPLRKYNNVWNSSFYRNSNSISIYSVFQNENSKITHVYGIKHVKISFLFLFCSKIKIDIYICLYVYVYQCIHIIYMPIYMPVFIHHSIHKNSHCLEFGMTQFLLFCLGQT